MTENVADNRYRVGELLGRGGMASVWHARDTSAEMNVALKVLHPHLVDNEGIVEAFEREAELMRKLDASGVARVYETTSIDGRPAFAMELLKSGDLAERIAPDTPIGEQRAVEIMDAVLETLQAVHDRDIIHGDIKPHNIMFDSDDRPRFIDFGVGQAEELLNCDESGQLGTVEYMAPERIDGLAIDARADIYSAGVVLFEMLCGHPPYRAETASAVMRMHRESEVADPRAFNENVTDRVADVVMRAIAKHPDDRFDRADQMARVLRGDDAPPVGLEEHAHWQLLRRRVRTARDMAAPVDESATEWVLYVPSEVAESAPAFDTTVLRQLLDDYPAFVACRDQIAGALDDAEERGGLRDLLDDFGIARGLSRTGIDELLARFDNADIPVCYGRRPRVPEDAASWRRALVSPSLWNAGFVIAFGIVAAAICVAVVAGSEIPTATRNALFFGFCVVSGLLVGRIGLPDAYTEWWRMRFSDNFLLDFAICADDDSAIDTTHCELLDEIASPRIAASYERASNALLHIRDAVADDELTARTAAAIQKLAGRIIELESNVATVRPGRLATRILRLDQQIASEDEVDEIERMMDEKARLKRRLTARDQNRQNLRSLAQRTHEVARRLEDLAHRLQANQNDRGDEEPTAARLDEIDDFIAID